MGRGVEALTLFAVPELVIVPKLAAVAFVVLTFRHIVLIIAESVTQMLVNTSGTLVVGVLAYTLLTVARLNMFVGKTAITTIPVATGSVVAVITHPVALVRLQSTFDLAALAIGIPAFTFFTVDKLFRVVVVTTIAIIPVAFFEVVFVVAVRVALVLGELAFVDFLFAVAAIACAFEDIH